MRKGNERVAWCDRWSFRHGSSWFFGTSIWRKILTRRSKRTVWTWRSVVGCFQFVVVVWIMFHVTKLSKSRENKSNFKLFSTLEFRREKFRPKNSWKRNELISRNFFWIASESKIMIFYGKYSKQKNFVKLIFNWFHEFLFTWTFLNFRPAIGIFFLRNISWTHQKVMFFLIFFSDIVHTLKFFPL